MTDQIRQLKRATPFSPFTISMADGTTFRIATPDNVAVPPGNSRVFVFEDTGDYHMLVPSTINSVELA